jgi:hypothetical protein
MSHLVADHPSALTGDGCVQLGLLISCIILAINFLSCANCTTNSKISTPNLQPYHPVALEDGNNELDDPMTQDHIRTPAFAPPQAALVLSLMLLIPQPVALLLSYMVITAPRMVLLLSLMLLIPPRVALLLSYMVITAPRVVLLLSLMLLIASPVALLLSLMLLIASPLALLLSYMVITAPRVALLLSLMLLIAPRVALLLSHMAMTVPWMALPSCWQAR